MKRLEDGEEGSVAERVERLRYEALGLFFPIVSETFKPVILGGFRLDYGGNGNEFLKSSVHTALENLTVRIFEAWCEILLSTARSNPAKLLGLETLNQYMLPQGYDQEPFLKAQSDFDILSYGRILNVLRRVRKNLPGESRLPQPVIELINRCGCQVVMRH